MPSARASLTIVAGSLERLLLALQAGVLVLQAVDDRLLLVELALGRDVGQRVLHVEANHHGQHDEQTDPAGPVPADAQHRAPGSAPRRGRGGGVRTRRRGAAVAERAGGIA